MVFNRLFISATQAYKDLRFDAKNIVDNIQRFHQWRNHLPILPIYPHKVNISTKKNTFNQLYLNKLIIFL